MSCFRQATAMLLKPEPSATRCAQILCARHAVTCIVGSASSTGSSVNARRLPDQILFSMRDFLLNIDLSAILMCGVGQVGESSSAAQINNRQYHAAQSQSIPPITPTPPTLLPDVILNPEGGVSSDSSSTEVSIAEEYNVHEFQGGYGMFSKESTTPVGDRDRLVGYVIKEIIHTWAKIEHVYSKLSAMEPMMAIDVGILYNSEIVYRVMFSNPIF